MRCIVKADGKLKDCVVLKEAPAGFDFGKAALRMAPLFRMRRKPGAPSVEGATVIIPMRWGSR